MTAGPFAAFESAEALASAGAFFVAICRRGLNQHP
jgi:hypothetical protein